MQVGGNIAWSAGAWLVGAAVQVVNEITDRIHVPGLGLPPGPVGDVLEPPGPDARAGASLIHRIADAIDPTPAARGPVEARWARPLLATAEVFVPAGADAAHLAFDVAAPGTSWGDDDHPSGVVAAYVDGRYVGTTVVPGERTGTVRMLLDHVEPGMHRVELRAAAERQVDPSSRVVVSHVRAEATSGFRAVIERHAPLLELRDAARAGALEAASTDAPLAMFPVVTAREDGGVRIDYRVVFSNEDGGSVTSALMSQYGRALDVEPVLVVDLDRTGRVVRRQYQTGVHDWRDFDGTFEGSHPLLRVSSRNNMTSARLDGSAGAERFAEVPLGPSEHLSDSDVVDALPWIRRVGELELRREGKVAVPGAEPGRNQVVDPNRYVVVGPMSGAERARIIAAGGVDVVLHDGRVVRAAVRSDFAAGEYATGGAILPEGVSRDQVAAIRP